MNFLKWKMVLPMFAFLVYLTCDNPLCSCTRWWWLWNSLRIWIKLC